MKLPSILSQSAEILQTEGLRALVRAGRHKIMRSTVHYRTVEIYEFLLTRSFGLVAAESPPGVESVVVCGAADRVTPAIAGQALCDFDRAAPTKLSHGAEAVCLFDGDGLAHVTWVARTPAAKSAFDPLPYPVQFDSDQGCVGGSFTRPHARQRGLGAYGVRCALAHLQETGATSVRGAIALQNLASQRMNARFPHRIVGRIRSLRLLRWELPLPVRDRVKPSASA